MAVPLYEWVAEKVVEWGNASMDGEYSNVGAVVGATYPEMSRILRNLMPHTYSGTDTRSRRTLRT